MNSVFTTPNIYGLEAQITCPVLVVQGEGEGAVPRQMATAYMNKLKTAKHYHLLTAHNGADNHCGLGNLHYTHQTLYDWFADTLSVSRWTASKEQVHERAV